MSVKSFILIFFTFLTSGTSFSQSSLTLQANYGTLEEKGHLPLGTTSFVFYAIRPTINYSYSFSLNPKISFEPTVGINIHGTHFCPKEWCSTPNETYWHNGDVLSLSFIPYTDFNLTKRLSIGIAPGLYFNALGWYYDSRNQSGSWNRSGKLESFNLAVLMRVKYKVHKNIHLQLGYYYDLTTLGTENQYSSRKSYYHRYGFFTGLQFTFPKK